jgi:CHAT domain-containing protein/tetratricopeptide (TPR) repeat protein
MNAQEGSPDMDKEIYNQAAKAFSKGSYDTAMKLWNTSLQIRMKKPDGANSVAVANVMNGLGAIKSQLGFYDEAISFYEKALSIYEAAGDKELKKLASVIHNLGICYSKKGDIEKARTHYENAGRIFEKLKLTNEYETLLTNITVDYIDNKNIAEAEKYNKKSFEVNPNSPLNYKKWTSTGLIYSAKKEYAKSIYYLKKAIEIGVKVLGKDFAEEGQIYSNLGSVYIETGDFEQSMANFRIARELIEKKNGTNNISYSKCLNGMGLNYLRKKENESDLNSFFVQRKMNIETALDYFQKAIMAITPEFKPADHFSNPIPENTIDKVILLDILKNKAEALSIMAQLAERQETKEVYVQLSTKALDTYDLSIKLIYLIRNGFQNQVSRLFLAENEHPVYSKAIEVAVRLYESTSERRYFEKGFEFSERSRSADFQTMLSELQAKEFSDLPDSLLRKDEEFKGEIDAYENDIFKEKSSHTPDQQKINLWKDKVFSLNQSYQQMIAVIETKYPRYYQYKYANPIVSVQQIQHSLGRREAFIEYYTNEGRTNGEDELYVFVLTDHEFKIIRQTLNKDFNNTVNHFLQFLKNSNVLNTTKADYLQFVSSAFYLYKFLIQPVIPSLQNYRLIIVPDNVLSYLPFDAFLASPADSTKMDFRHLDYLVHHHAISYTYSATLLYYYFQNKLKYSNKLAAFAPDYNIESDVSDSNSEHFLPLPGAESEVIGVTGIISGDQYIGARATKKIFKLNAEKYDILHLAMHTSINDSLPLYSKMVFSADNSAGNDRTLNTYEIYNLKLKSDMVVLSGCNTGTGKLQKGEGVMSLARAFLYAGCPSIIMTLWNVEDVSSASIMIDFYQNIKNGFSKDEALRRAKVNYIAQADPLKAHPYFWLGYVSIGKQTPLYKTKVGYFVGLIIFVFLAIVLEKWYFKRKRRYNRLK